MNPRAITFVLRVFMFIVILLSIHNIISLVKNSQTYKHHSINIDKTLNIPFIVDLNNVSSPERGNSVALTKEFRGCDGAERVATDPEYGTPVEYSNSTITSNKITIKIPNVDNDPYFLTMLFM